MAVDGRRVVLITGCSPGGIGHALCMEFQAQGCHVIATARNVSVLDDLRALGMTTLPLDVTSHESILTALSTISALTGGKLDILVNNAGRNYTMPLLDASPSESRACFETNFFAPLLMIQTFAPLLIAASPKNCTNGKSDYQSLIMNIGSISGVMPLPYSAVYNASKAALHSLASTVRLELAPFNVRVLTMITGGVKSNIATHDRPLPEGSLYAPVKDMIEERAGKSQSGGMDTREYASGVVREALGKRPRTEVWRGGFVWLVWFVARWVGEGGFDWILPKMFGLVRLKKMLLGGKVKGA